MGRRAYGRPRWENGTLAIGVLEHIAGSSKLCEAQQFLPVFAIIQSTAFAKRVTYFGSASEGRDQRSS